MIKWDLILKKARLRLADAEEDSQEEKRLVKIAKYCKFRIDSNIYQRKETVIYWDSSEKVEQETKTSIEVIPSKDFYDFCGEKYKSTVYEKQYIFQK